jgi:hypothetical protein
VGHGPVSGDLSVRAIYRTLILYFFIDERLHLRILLDDLYYPGESWGHRGAGRHFRG